MSKSHGRREIKCPRLAVIGGGSARRQHAAMPILPRSALTRPRELSSRPTRLLIGQLYHETHGFNPVPTRLADLKMTSGAQLLSRARGTGTILGGILEAADRRDMEVIGSTGFFAQPSGPIEHEAFETARDALLSRAGAGDFDAVALDLHGAMGTTRIDDADGDLLVRLRAVVGPDVPIVIGLDMHAHVTQAMLACVDIAIACKASPHTDFVQTGHHLVDLLADMRAGRLRPVMAMAKAPMIHLDAGLTASGPLGLIVRQARTMELDYASVRDVSLFQVYRFSDYREQKGQTALVLTDNDPETAERLAEELARAFWGNREHFVAPGLSIDEALDEVARRPDARPFVLADTGDRVLAGGPGDSPAILAAALARTDGLRAAIPLTDPPAVETAWAAGIGARIAIAVGGAISPGVASVVIEGEVVHLGDGEFEVSGAVFEGERASLGRCAVIVIDNRLSLLVTSKPGLSHTPAAFESQGIEVRKQDFVVAKSGMHFQANFGASATPLIVDTPGLTAAGKGAHAWINPHFWPETDIETPDLGARTYGAASRPRECDHRDERS